MVKKHKPNIEVVRGPYYNFSDFETWDYACRDCGRFLHLVFHTRKDGKKRVFIKHNPSRKGDSNGTP